MMEVIAELDTSVHHNHANKLLDIEERLKLVEHSIYGTPKANTRFDDIYERLEKTDIELKQHCSDCVDTIAALDKRTDFKVFEQDRKLDELDAFRKLTTEINTSY